MKKLILGILCITLCIGALSGCGSKDASSDGAQSETVSNEISVDEVGVKYTVPDEWNEFKETHLYPLTLQAENIFAEIIYGYATDEDIALLNSDPTAKAYKTITPICEILVAKTATFEENVNAETINAYENAEKVGEQGEYTYYFLWGFKNAASKLKDKDLENYNLMLESAVKFKDSISIYEFDDTLIGKTTEILNTTISFNTQTIEGAPVDSTIFAPYDLTMLHFSGTYTYPDYDEFETLQGVYEIASQFKDKVNIIEAVIDAPNEEAQEKAIEAKEKAGAKNILTIVMDETLGAWVQSNLKAIPSTIFVNSEGRIVGEILVGTQNQEKYLEEISIRLRTADGVSEENGGNEQETSAEQETSSQAE